MTYFLTIYFSGFIFTYLLSRFVHKFIDKLIWTKEFRLKAIFVSFLSWLGLVTLLYHAADNYSDDSPASW